MCISFLGEKIGEYFRGIGNSSGVIEESVRFDRGVNCSISCTVCISFLGGKIGEYFRVINNSSGFIQGFHGFNRGVHSSITIKWVCCTYVQWLGIVASVIVLT